VDVSDSPTTEAAQALAAVFDELGLEKVSLADVLRLDPATVSRLVDAALAQAQAGRPAAAETVLAHLSRVEGTSALLPYLLAAVRAEAGQHAAAVDACREALRRDGADASTAPFRGEVLLLLGRERLALGETEAAREALDAAVAVDGAAAEVAQAILRGLS